MKKLKILVFSWFLIQPFLGLSQEQKIISLNGNWEIVFDHNNQGANLNWQEDEVFKTLKNDSLVISFQVLVGAEVQV